MSPIHIDHPFHFDHLGRTATTDLADHVRDMIEQLLFTSPGERVNRPDFGCGLLQLVFEPASEALAATTQMTVQGALQRWLGDRVHVDRVSLETNEGTLRVTVVYRPRAGGASRAVSFEREA